MTLRKRQCGGGQAFATEANVKPCPGTVARRKTHLFVLRNMSLAGSMARLARQAAWTHLRSV